jgi:hypothetical protein
MIRFEVDNVRGRWRISGRAIMGRGWNGAELDEEMASCGAWARVSSLE